MCLLNIGMSFLSLFEIIESIILAFYVLISHKLTKLKEINENHIV